MTFPDGLVLPREQKDSQPSKHNTSLLPVLDMMNCTSPDSLKYLKLKFFSTV